MKQRKIIYSFLLAAAAIVFVLFGIATHAESQDLRVIFLDVGQGDSILIEQGDKQILIDGGPDAKTVLEKLGKFVPFWDRKIEVVMATHPDADHIAGLIEVMKNYEIGEVIDNGVSVDSGVYQKYKEAISKKNINELEGGAGMKIKIGKGAEMEILSPDGTEDKNNPKDTNLSSLVAKLTYGEKSFLFTGDLPILGEKDLINRQINLKSDVLKVAHHGSKYSTSDGFLDIAKPKEAVISVGKNNRYGHPAEEVINKLNSRGIKILRTDEAGDVEYDL